MARTGLYKSEVKTARDSLLAQGRHPSVDAVRIALGNTGSKTTIHKYLKELEEEDGGAAKESTLSETLSALVGQLATQLQLEANAELKALHTEVDASTQRFTAELEARQAQQAVLRDTLKEAQDMAAASQQAHAETTRQLQQQSQDNHSLRQQLDALKERLAENEAHRQSLEEKHQHARQALEHYRTATKEQRDQDLRRHEQQVQGLQTEIRQLRQDLIVRQDETTRLNQEGVRLVSELSHAQKDVREQHLLLRQSEQKLEALRAVESRNLALDIQLDEKTSQHKGLQEQTNALTAQLTEALTASQALRTDLAVAHAREQAQQTLIDALREHMAQASRPPESPEEPNTA